MNSYLFIMAVELLAISIKENDNIRGTIVEGTEIKISQLADDTSCFVRDLSSLAEMLSIFTDFQQCAGLSVNVDKPKARYLGFLKGVQEFPFDLDWSETNVYLLGVILSGNDKEHYDLSLKKRILNMKNLLNSWKCRNVSLKGKITIVNTLTLSSLPSMLFKTVKHIVVDFIWEGET